MAKKTLLPPVSAAVLQEPESVKDIGEEPIFTKEQEKALERLRRDQLERPKVRLDG